MKLRHMKSSFDKEHCIGNVKLQAIDVKHAEDIKCYGYILEFPNQKIYYSGDAYEVPDIVVKNFYAGEIDKIRIQQNLFRSFVTLSFECFRGTFSERREKMFIVCIFLMIFTKKLLTKGLIMFG